MSQLESMFEDLQSQIDEHEKRIQELEVAEYNRMNILFLTDGLTAPDAVSDWALIYVDTADGDLKVKFSNGFVAVIAADS